MQGAVWRQTPQVLVSHWRSLFRAMDGEHCRGGLGRWRALVAALTLLFTVTFAVHVLRGNLRLLLSPYPDAKLVSSKGVVRQKGVRECGIAVLAMFLEATGRAIRYEELSAHLSVTPDGISLRAMQEAARNSGVSLQTWFIDPSDIERLPLPAIGLVKGGHYVLVESYGDQGTVILVDLSVGRLKLRLDRLRKIWSGPALISEPLYPPGK